MKKLKRNAKNDVFYKLLKLVLSSYKLLGVLLIVVSFGLIVLNINPEFWYYLDPSAVDRDTETLLSPIVNAENDSNYIIRADDFSFDNMTDDSSKSSDFDNNNSMKNFSAAIKLPPKDMNLPKTPTLIIEKIGINGQIRQGSNGDEILQKGIWMPPGANNPKTKEPVVLISHRFGIIGWDYDYKQKNWFKRLPELRGGDIIKVIYDQRMFTYEVISTFVTGNSSFSINADLTLYTCENINSEKRIIIEAKNIL